MLIRLWKYFRGYVIIEVYGFSVERFMNLATNKGIYLWNVYRQGNKLVMNVSIKGFKMLKSCTRKTRCRVKVRQKIGLPFILHKYRKRKIFLLGALITGFILFMLSSILWTIEINGNERFSDHDILAILEKEGCQIGVSLNKINCDEIEDRILSDYPDISWISMEIKGSGLFVNIEEAVEKPDIKKTDLPPANIVADKDCLIEYIVTRSGKPLVKKGDVVKKGDMLVTGELEIVNDDQTVRYAYVKADADIKGKVYYKIEDEVPYAYTEKNYTKRKKYEFFIRITSHKWKVFGPFKSFQNYDKSSEVKEFYFFGYKLPFEVVKDIHYEYKPVEKEYNKQEAEELLEKKINKFIDKSFDDSVQIIDKKIVYTNKKDRLACDVKLTVLINIGEEQLIRERKEEWTEETKEQQ